MTTREKLHALVDELTDAEAEAVLVRLTRERELLRGSTIDRRRRIEDTWAAENARQAIREEPW